jgi:hypothetical protein
MRLNQEKDLKSLHLLNLMTTSPEKNYINTGYPFQVWLTTIIIVAPLFLICYSLLFLKNEKPLSEDYSWIILIPFGLLFSLPVFTIQYVLFIILAKKRLKALGIKLTLCITCLIGVFLTFHIIGGTSEHNFRILYSTSVILPSFIFKVYQNKPAVL